MAHCLAMKKDEIGLELLDAFDWPTSCRGWDRNDITTKVEEDL
jgi:hypothetical protein